MGRRTIAPVALAAAVALGCTAGPAMATSSHATKKQTRTTLRTFSNGTRKVSRSAFDRMEVRAFAQQPGNDQNTLVYRHSFKAECTVPVASSKTGYMNIYSTDTSDVVDVGGFFPQVVGTCSANLAKKQTGADKSDSGMQVSIPFTGKYTTGGYECAISNPHTGPTLYGDEESVVYPDGLFVSVCIANVIDE